MKHQLPRSGLSSEASRTASPSTAPQTPPYTPIATRSKRRLERSDSPASSIHPTETISPAKKISKRRSVPDDIKVEELVEGDAGYYTDAEIVYPHELEELNSSNDDGDDELSSGDEIESHVDATGILSRRLSRLQCGDDEAEVAFEMARRRRRLSVRTSPRLFKRSHSQSVQGDGEQTDDDAALDDQDVGSSQRRLRRRVREAVEEEEIILEFVPGGSPRATMAVLSAGRAWRPATPEQEREQERKPLLPPYESDDMDVDDTK